MSDPASPASTPQPHLGDALVLCMTRGMSLGAWESSGVLNREWALYERLRARYGRIVVFSYGGADEQRLGAERGAGVVTGDEDTAADRVRDHLARFGVRSVVIKTNQFQGGDTALRIADSLRAAGIVCALAARGGYPWSRFEAYRHGADSPEAAAASDEEARLCRAADAVIGTTRAMLDELAWRYALPASRLHVVPNYVLGAGPANATGCGRVILGAGRLEAQKRFDLLVRGVSGLGTDATLRIIGEGPMRGELERLAGREGVRLELPGRLSHEELLNQMRSCTMFVQCSAYEGHPKTVLEAMSAGACVVVTPTPGLGDVVEHGVTGWVARDDERSLRAVIRALWSDPGKRATLGEAAARHATGAFSLDVVAAAEVRAHESAVQARAEGGGAPWSGVRLVVFDFDGVMSNNQVLVMQDGTEGVLCNRSDGLGLEMLRKGGVPALVLSKEKNPVVSARCRKLGLECLQGVDDKLGMLQKLAAERGLAAGDIAYVGNDINDAECMRWVGLPVAVADAYPGCLSAAKYVTRARGGHGAVREVCERIIGARPA